MAGDLEGSDGDRMATRVVGERSSWKSARDASVERAGEHEGD